jgi:hypothetical protein
MAMRRQEHDDEHVEGIENETDSALEISPEIRRRIKRAAAENNLSVEEYLKKALPLETYSNTQQGIITTEAIEKLRQLRNQMLQDHQDKPFEDSTEMIRQMREERTQHLESLLGE